MYNFTITITVITRTSKKTVDGRSTNSHDNKKFRNSSMEKQRGMAFGFRKTVTAVEKNGYIFVYVYYIYMYMFIYI